MSEAETIKEFLVALGWKIDEVGQKKFSGAIGNATKDVFKMGAAISGAISALELFTDKMASSVENLYFMSQRTHASIANIQGAGYAATQLGSSFDGAAASIENMGEMLRNNPAAEAYLNSLKVKTRDANGALMDTTKITQNLVGQLAQMPNWQAKQFADFFKIDEKTLLAMKSGDFARWMDDHNRRLAEAGVNMQDLGVQSHIYEENWRQLKDEIGIAGDQLLGKVLPASTSILRVTESWLEDLTSGTSKLDQIKGGHYKGFGDYIDKRGVGGFLWDSLVTGGGAIASTEYDALKLAGKTAYVGGATILGGKDAGPNAVRNAFGPGQSATAAGDQETQIFKRLMGMGWTAQQAAGIMSNLNAESGYNPAATGDNGQAHGIGQWHGDREAVFKQLFGHDLAHSNLDEQLEFVNWELRNSEARAGNALQGTGGAGDSGAVVSALYERPKDTFGQAHLRSEDAERIFARQQAAAADTGNPVTINQTNNVTVHGASDPHATASAVGRAQASANESLTRNAAGAVQ